MRKTRDYLYLIFVGLILFLCGSIILGCVSYLIDRFIGIDFISVILYFFVAIFLTKQVLKGIEIRNKFVSIILPIFTALMFILKDYVAIVVFNAMSGVSFLQIIKSVPLTMWYNFIGIFTASIDAVGVFNFILNILFFIIDILIMGVGIYYSYRITKRM